MEKENNLFLKSRISNKMKGNTNNLSSVKIKQTKNITNSNKPIEFSLSVSENNSNSERSLNKDKSTKSELQQILCSNNNESKLDNNEFILSKSNNKFSNLKHLPSSIENQNTENTNNLQYVYTKRTCNNNYYSGKSDISKESTNEYKDLKYKKSFNKDRVKFCPSTSVKLKSNICKSYDFNYNSSLPVTNSINSDNKVIKDNKVVIKEKFKVIFQNPIAPCPICYYEYDMENRFPLVNSCGHSFCNKCYLSRSGLSQCFFCKRELNINKNFALIEALEQVKDKQKNHRSQSMKSKKLEEKESNVNSLFNNKSSSNEVKSYDEYDNNPLLSIYAGGSNQNDEVIISSNIKTNSLDSFNNNKYENSSNNNIFDKNKINIDGQNEIKVISYQQTTANFGKVSHNINYNEDEVQFGNENNVVELNKKSNPLELKCFNNHYLTCNSADMCLVCLKFKSGIGCLECNYHKCYDCYSKITKLDLTIDFCVLGHSLYWKSDKIICNMCGFYFINGFTCKVCPEYGKCIYCNIFAFSYESCPGLHEKLKIIFLKDSFFNCSRCYRKRNKGLGCIKCQYYLCGYCEHNYEENHFPIDKKQLISKKLTCELIPENYFLSFAREGKVYLWCYNLDFPVSEFYFESEIYSPVIVSYNDKICLLVGVKNNIKLYDFINNEDIMVLRKHKGIVNRLLLLENSTENSQIKYDNSIEKNDNKKYFRGSNTSIPLKQRRFISASKDKTIVLWNLEGENEEIVTLENFYCTGLLQLSHNTIVVSEMKSIYMIDINSKKITCKWQEHEDLIRCFLKLNDNKFISGGTDSLIKIWDITKPENSIKTIRLHNESIMRFCKLSSNILISCSVDKTIKLYNINNDFEFICTLNTHSEAVNDIQCNYFIQHNSNSNENENEKDDCSLINENCSRFISCGSDCTIINWEFSHNKCRIIGKYKAFAPIWYVIPLSKLYK